MGIAEGIGCRVIAVTDDVAALPPNLLRRDDSGFSRCQRRVIRDLVGGWGVDGVLGRFRLGLKRRQRSPDRPATQGGAIVVAGTGGGFVPIGAGRLNRNGSARYVEGGSRGDLREVLDLLDNQDHG